MFVDVCGLYVRLRHVEIVILFWYRNSIELIRTRNCLTKKLNVIVVIVD